MKRLITVHDIILYFYGLLLLGVFVLADYFLFAVILNLFDLIFVIIFLALLSGLGVLFSLNSILSLFRTIKANIMHSEFSYLLFAQIVVILISGTLMAIPGIVTSLVGWVTYFKPIRLLITRVVLKQKSKAIRNLYAHFLVENTH